MRILKWDFRFNTFFKRGLPRVDDRYGIYMVCGKQGSGKTYYGVYLLTKQDKKKVNKVYTNVKSLNIPGYDINYFDTVDELYFNTEENCIFLIDEMSRKYDRNTKTDKPFYAWLNQSRKRKRIVIMVTQEWRELPMWIRRPVKFMIATTKTRLLKVFGIYTSIVGDAENMMFNKDEGEYECPPIRFIFYKRNKKIADMYDTFEAINEL